MDLCQPQSNQRPQRILVRAPNWLGDQVMALPFYRALRAHYPRAHLSLLCLEQWSEFPFENLFDKIIPFIRPRSFFQLQALAARLRAEQFDAVYNLPASYSSSLLCFLARIPHRIGFSQAGSGLWLTMSLPWTANKTFRHKSALYCDLLRMNFGEAYEAKPTEVGKVAPSPIPKIVVAPGASIPLREWPYLRSLILELQERFPTWVIQLVGTKREAHWHHWVSQQSGKQIEDWIERTTLRELLGLCKEAHLVIANDSGVAHLAGSLAGVPTLVLFGPGDPRYVAPLGPHVSVARVDLPCSPCESARCDSPYGYQACLREMGLDRVLLKVSEILAQQSRVNL